MYEKRCCDILCRTSYDCTYDTARSQLEDRILLERDEQVLK